MENNCLSHTSETKFYSEMGSLSNRHLLSKGSREEKKSEVSMVAGMVFS